MKISKGTVMAALVLTALCLGAAADGWVVKVQTTALRKNPQFYAPVVANLKAGELLTQVSASGAWLQVKTAAGATGWVHKSAVEVPRYALMASAGGARTQAAASQAALAGKGFSKQVEDAYKAKNKGANFAGVDRMLQVKVTPAEVKAFLDQGRLGATGGAQ
ncbi:MAG: SH3 domain-containing protein [Candidatus Aminicenantes bacterium]|nr:SH3 domain-containing protein [Candidatus Aminicenantes bacterium]